ncbi:MAG: RAD55 family ATPase [Thermoplasmata archaeon]
MEKRIKTGIEGFDSSLDGGLLPGHVVMLLGESMSGRETFLHQYFYTGLKEDEGSVFVTTRMFHDEVKAVLENYGWQTDPYIGKFIFIDAYTPQSDPTVMDTGTVRYVHSVADFAKLSNTIVTSLTEFHNKGMERKRIAFDSIDTLLMYLSAQAVYRFLSYLRAKIKGFKATAVMMLDNSIHQEKDVKTLTQLADIIATVNQNDSTITIQSLGRPPARRRYEITNQGFSIQS